MRYLSVCSGIEAATVAWHDLGWTPVAFSEIEPFPSAVLAHHYPHVPNVGDMTKFKEWNLEPIDLLVGGTPCQSFSVAGLRKGLHDPRGGLMLTFLEIAQRYRPRWVVWENVPGVLSSNGGRDFGAFLGALGELGYGWAYRVLDAQWFGVAQRRRRVFVVGCLGDQASAAAVLFESESVCRNSAPSREARKIPTSGVVPSVVGSLDTECGGGKLTHQSVQNGHVIGTITARMFNALGARDVEEGALLPVAQPVAFAQNTRDEVRLMNGDGSIVGALAAEPGMKQTCYVAQPVAFRDPCPTLTAKMQGSSGWAPANEDAHLVGVAQPVACATGDRAHALTTRSAAEEDGTGRGTPIVPVAQSVLSNDPAHAICANEQRTYTNEGDVFQLRNVVAQPAAIAFKVRGGVEVDSAGKAAGKGYLGSEETAFTLAATQDQWLAAPQPVAFPINTLTLGGRPDLVNDARMTLGIGSDGDPQFTLQAAHSHAVATAMQVRRLTPVECERLQGFPDGYTNIPWRKKPEAPDGPRYKALGNSMAVPCMRWIGERIDAETRQEASK